MTDPQKSYFLSNAIPFAGVAPFAQLQVVPPVNIVQRRIAEIADFYGLIATPQWYTAKVGTEGAGLLNVKLEVSQDAMEGPFFVTALQFPGGLDERLLEVSIQSGSRKLTEGRVRAFDCFAFPFVTSAESLAAPIVVLRGDSLILGMRQLDVTDPFEASDGVLIQGLVLRSQNGERLGAIADEIAALVRKEGEFYAAGVVSNATNASINISSTMIIQTLVIGCDQADTGIERALGLGVGLGNYFPFPAQGEEPTGLDVDVLEETAPFEGVAHIQTDLRYPLRAGSRLVLFSRYAGVEPARSDSHVAIIGRREQVS